MREFVSSEEWKKNKDEENSMDLDMPCEIIWNECNGRRLKCIWLCLNGRLAGLMFGCGLQAMSIAGWVVMCTFFFLIWMIINVTAVQIHSNIRSKYTCTRQIECGAWDTLSWPLNWISYTPHMLIESVRSSRFNRKQPSYDLFVLPVDKEKN